MLLAMMTSSEIASALERPRRKWRDRKLLHKELEGIAKRNGIAVIPAALRLIRERKHRHLAGRLLHSLDRNDKAAVPLLIDALHDHRGWAHYTAASALARLIRPAAPPRLLELLNHPDPGTRAAAVDAVVMSGLYSFKTLPALRRALDDPEKQVRQSIYFSAHKLRDRPLTAKLFAERIDSEEGTLRRSILYAFTRLDARPWLHRIMPLVHDADEYTRSEALYAVARGGRFPPEVFRLSMAALDDDSLQVRGTALWILKRYKGKLPRNLIPKIMRNLKSKRSWTAWQSAHLLARMNAVEAIEPLRVIAADDSSRSRHMARFVLKKLERN